MTHETPPSAYEPRRQEVSGSDDSGNAHHVRGDIEGRLDRTVSTYALQSSRAWEHAANTWRHGI
ncbi:hypothetical protein PIB30_071842 [Stylosanthes scabra]|uniref:Uncharacterized protein n=1 Tax=Stylosanthes scabra TaxID=79078 RepID=A0ABU6SQD0_9FABA|nr:hypothetical protein [Stylosanthes scabra]